MPSDTIPALSVRDVSKCYQIYAKPQDRLKQSLHSRLRRLWGGRGKSYFREFWALKDVSFEVARGETVGIIGRNGSGKSTLLQIICGTLVPTLGVVQTQGRVAALLEFGSGFNPEFTGRENIHLNAMILGITRDEIEARFDSMVAFSELGEFIDQPVKAYSSGMYVRLAFAIAIHVSPDILIVDEALAVGDARFQAKCMRRFKEIQESGTTILFVSHDVVTVRTLCGRAIWLDQGRLRMIGDVFPVTGHYVEYLFDDQYADEPIRRSSDQCSPGKKDQRPITHWGSHLGTIRSAGIYDIQGNRKDVIRWNEEVEVRLVFSPAPDMDRSNLSAAFSIKDLKGTDLIVSTTHDHQPGPFDPKAHSFTITYRFRNPLVTGEYLLVAAIEDRAHAAIHYYEYLEGAQYFCSLAEEHYFGVFQPEIIQSLRSEP